MFLAATIGSPVPGVGEVFTPHKLKGGLSLEGHKMGNRIKTLNTC